MGQLALADTDSEAASTPAASVDTHYLLCDIHNEPGINAPHTLINSDTQADTATRYQQIASACFSEIQRVIRSKPTQTYVLHVVINDAQFMGLAGMLRTMQLEKPLAAWAIDFD